MNLGSNLGPPVTQLFTSKRLHFFSFIVASAFFFEGPYFSKKLNIKTSKSKQGQKKSLMEEEIHSGTK